MRCFVAIELSAGARSALARALEAVSGNRDVRWVAAAQLHITLKFLGDVDDGRVREVIRVVRAAAAGIPPFALRLGRFGAFPDERNPRIFWCRVEDREEGCAAWLAAADPALAQLGFAPEQRAFRPHVTLGRSRSRRGGAALADLLRSPPRLRDPGPFDVDEVVLFESVLGPGGPRYTALDRAPLGG